MYVGLTSMPLPGVEYSSGIYVVFKNTAHGNSLFQLFGDLIWQFIIILLDSMRHGMLAKPYNVIGIIRTQRLGVLME